MASPLRSYKLKNDKPRSHFHRVLVNVKLSCGGNIISQSTVTVASRVRSCVTTRGYLPGGSQTFVFMLSCYFKGTVTYKKMKSMEKERDVKRR